jgi:hypothetical protein
VSEKTSILGNANMGTVGSDRCLLCTFRDPDQYYFRTTPLPLNIYSPPHDDEAKRIIAPPGTEGKLMKGNGIWPPAT